MKKAGIGSREGIKKAEAWREKERFCVGQRGHHDGFFCMRLDFKAESK